ncbi:MAG: DNA polymerase III subunit epsilon [Gammaproteobacteria bacterium RBG_16_57_12]|nr:MAG: DNA polymerase III subunit epsilon [Gammaproteobacteria bacterium RBG_16_57_12]
MRQIILDTETTGLEPSQGHRIIEIGCVELVERRLTGNNYQCYLQPDREIDEGAIEVHGITNEFLGDKPRFADMGAEFLEYIRGAELIIHNAPFDVGFINAEFTRLDEAWRGITEHCQITDTLAMARKKHPGQKNNLDALCKRYNIDNSHRQMHGALLDAEILADVYLAMTGGQVMLFLGGNSDTGGVAGTTMIRRLSKDRPRLKVLLAHDDELTAHQARLDAIDKTSGGNCLWKKLEG